MKIYNVYDIPRLKMGKDEAWMGFFPTREEAEQYILEYKHLFEGESQIEETERES